MVVSLPRESFFDFVDAAQESTRKKQESPTNYRSGTDNSNYEAGPGT
jgi:hypothetical protein